MYVNMKRETKITLNLCELYTSTGPLILDRLLVVQIRFTASF